MCVVPSDNLNYHFERDKASLHKMSDSKLYHLTEYRDNVLLVRKDYLPLMVYFGKNEYSYWFTTPPADNAELEKKFSDWFHKDFVEIVSHIVAKRNIRLGWDQKKPSNASRGFGWYLPIGVLLEIQKMWAEEHVPIVFDILRPTDLIYGRAFTSRKRETIGILDDYYLNKPVQKT